MPPLYGRKIAAGDALTVRVAGTIPEWPIGGRFVVESSGNLPLGPVYGRVFVHGLTHEQGPTEETIQAGSQVRIRVEGTPGDQPIDGIYMVESTGKVALGPLYGGVAIAGMTYEQAEAEIATALKKILREPMVTVTSTENLRMARFELKFASADSARTMYEGLFPISRVRIESDTTANSILAVADSDEEMAQLRTFLEQLDRPSAADGNEAVDSVPAANAGWESLYDGKPYAHWVGVLRSEKRPDRLLRALQGVAALTDDGNGSTTCDVVFRTMRQFDSFSRYRSSSTEFGDQFADIALAALAQSNAHTIADYLGLELNEESTRSCDLVKRLFYFGFPENHERLETELWQVLSHDGAII